MSESVYIETTIISYLTGWHSKDITLAAQQAATKDWWEHQRQHFQLMTSEIVRVEASAGDPSAAAERMKALSQLPIIPILAEANQLSAALLAKKAIPPNAGRDAAHVAIAATNGVEYLLTWNCPHLANATLRTKIESVCRSFGFEPRIICTPLNFVG